MQIIELLTPAYEAAWLPWAVQYFFLAGVATGTALLGAACAFALQGSRLARLTPVVIFTLAIAAIAAPVSLLADLHQPGRFWHFYAHFTPWSWMSIGSLLLPAFVTLSLALCASWWLGRPGWMRRIAIWSGRSSRMARCWRSGCVCRWRILCFRTGSFRRRRSPACVRTTGMRFESARRRTRAGTKGCCTALLGGESATRTRFFRRSR